MKKLSKPVPEIVYPGKWIIKNGSGDVDIKGRILSVPLTQLERDKFVRRHELMHVKISPKVAKNADEYVAIVEDARVNMHLVDTFNEIGIVNAPIENIGQLPVKEIAKYAVAGCGTDAHIPLLQHLEETSNYHREVVDKALDMLMRGRETFRTTRKVADFLREALELYESVENNAKGKVPEPEEIEQSLRSGSILFNRANMGERSMPARFLQRKKSTDIGAIPRYPHRLYEDYKIFEKSKKLKKITVLFDVSGSMELEDDLLAEIVKLVPAAKIAMYAGYKGNIEDEHGNAGKLTIIGENGKIADSKEIARQRFDTGNNRIDFNAVRWLNEHDGLKIWVSDGGVTPAYHAFDSDHARQIFHYVDRNRIHSVSNPSTLIDYMKGKKVNREQIGRKYAGISPFFGYPFNR